MYTGTVKWFNAAKGFGFITSNQFPQDIFVHISAVKSSGLETLEEGQTVEFKVIPDKKDPSRNTAQNLRVTS